MLFSAKDLRLDFEGRDTELEDYNEALTKSPSNKSVVHFLCGESGVGKTRLLNEAAKSLSKENLDHSVTYHDISDDTRTKGKLFSNLLLTLWVSSTKTTRTNKKSFSAFLKRRKITEPAKKALYKGIYNALQSLPSFGKAAAALFEKDFKYEEKTKPIEIDIFQLLKDFFEFAVAPSKHTLQIDNFQRSTDSEKRELSALIDSLPNEFSVSLVIRQDSKNTLFDPYYLEHFHQFHAVIQILPNLDHTSIQNILNNSFPNMNGYQRDQLFLECLESTKENTREIEQFIINFKLANRLKEQNKASNKNNPIAETINQLGEIERALLIITSLFPEGIDFDYIRLFVEEDVNATRTLNLMEVVRFLVECKLLSILPEQILRKAGFSSIEIESIKASHDKVISAARVTMSDEEITEVRARLVDVISRFAFTCMDDNKHIEAMLLIMQIATSQELAKHVESMERTVSILHERNGYFDLSLLTEQVLEILDSSNNSASIFSLITITRLLDACVKESNFNTANRLLDKLGEARSPEVYNLYSAKVSAQLYFYDIALSHTANLLHSSEALSVHLNILQHQRQESEAKSIIQDRILAKLNYPRNDFEAIILRNSAHLFPYEKSVGFLNKALDWFENKEDIFTIATLHNNIGLNELYNKEPNIQVAREHLHKARNTLLDINSIEAYQATFNLGVCDVLEGKYDTSLKRLITAYNMVPKPLEYDRLKFLATILIVKAMQNSEELKTTISKLETMRIDANEISDPWLSFMLKKNLLILKRSKLKDCETNQIDKEIMECDNLYPGDSSQYSVFTRGEGAIPLLLAPSPHWRF
ncbi:AAA family ATPase [Pseudoalteromonas sp. MMG012]|uniref:AAA family ATPase n=1 Tax=Pseudoalteromonas sp. MMG012 TaxID=2822686 RepID=UPI001B3A5EAC|nr:ATP-binding protein [Pseudoalteromonas sp. MMG012]MBQ4849319.1 ATP-binding protein [Pseudoalteromonas sp. MMG012]